MASGKSRRLVIDTTVAGAAGRHSDFPSSKHCRDFLNATLQICHHVVMTPDLREEWNRHQTAFVSEWRQTMIAKKKFHFVRPGGNELLRDNLEKAATNSLAVKAGMISHLSLSQLKADDPNAGAKEAMLKDFRLLEAAIATDRIVISLDNKVCNFFAAASEQTGEIRDIIWVDPTAQDRNPIGWLERGAKKEKQHLLGHKSLTGKAK